MRFQLSNIICLFAVTFAATASGTGLVVWDSSLGGSYSYGVIDEDVRYADLPTFRAEPTHWHSPSISLLDTHNWRVNLSQYSYLWVALRTDYPGRVIAIDVTGWPSVSATVYSDAYTTRPLDGDWQVVVIPIADLRTEEYALSSVERIRFSRVGEAGYSFHVGGVWAVYDGVVPEPEPEPEPEPRPEPLNLGAEYADGEPVHKYVLVRNDGDAPFAVDRIYFRGDDAEAYTTEQGAFALEPAETLIVEVVIVMTEPRMYYADMVFVFDGDAGQLGSELVEHVPPTDPEPEPRTIRVLVVGLDGRVTLETVEVGTDGVLRVSPAHQAD